MSTITQQLGRMGKVVVATAITVGLSAGLAAAPASAASQPAAILKISYLGYDQYRISVTGVFPMSRADAQGHLQNAGTAGGMRYIVHGAEPADRGDDTLYISSIRGPAAGNTVSSALYDTPEGLRYSRSFVVDRSVLDEDGGPLDADDEVYVQAEFIDGAGAGPHTISDVLSARF